MSQANEPDERGGQNEPNGQNRNPGPPPAPSDLVQALVARGVRLSVTSGQLRVEAPRGVLTAADRAALAAHKEGIIALFTQAAGAETPEKEAGAAKKGPTAPGLDWRPRSAQDAQVAEVLEAVEELRRHPALPPALRALPPEKLGALVRWTAVALTNPRPVWPPRPLSKETKRHRSSLDDIIQALGGRPVGGADVGEEGALGTGDD